MNLINIVKENLIKTYLGSFDIKPLEPNRFVISIVGSEHQYFKVDVFLKNSVRLKISVKPEKYGTFFVNNIGKASLSQKEAFCAMWDNLTNGVLSIKVNNEILTKERFLNYSEVWNEFELNLSVFPLEDSETEPKEIIVAEYVLSIYAMIFSLISFEIEGFSEGKEIKVISTKHERNTLNRQICLEAKGYKCSVCNILLEDIYGPIAKRFIEVHHSNPVADMDDNYVVKPIKELFPVCPNCHAMLHRKNPPYSIDELRKIVSQNNDTSTNYALVAEPDIQYNINTYENN